MAGVFRSAGLGARARKLARLLLDLGLLAAAAIGSMQLAVATRDHHLARRLVGRVTQPLCLCGVAASPHGRHVRVREHGLVIAFGCIRAHIPAVAHVHAVSIELRIHALRDGEVHATRAIDADVEAELEREVLRVEWKVGKLEELVKLALRSMGRVMTS